jgi:hypothetical protein
MSEVIEALQKKIAANLRVAMPAIIKKYDFKTQAADVQIDIKELYFDGSYSDYPMISGVPVIFPRSGGASITMPVKVGDGCLIVFLDRDARSWLLGSSGGVPQSRRVHHLSDAVAIIGLNPFSKVSAAENNEDVLLQFSDSKIRLKPGGIIDIHNAKEINIKTENVIINCQKADITAKEANITASETINTKTPTFTQTGNMKIDGNIEITGTSLLKDKLTSQKGIENSGANLVSNGKIFESHTHDYIPALEPAPNPVPTGIAK